MRLVLIESPYRGQTMEEHRMNIAYARCAMRDAFMKGDIPIALHLLWTQPGVLSDAYPLERSLGISAAEYIRHRFDATIAYTGRGGFSAGMTRGMAEAKRVHQLETRDYHPEPLDTSIALEPFPEDLLK